VFHFGDRHLASIPGPAPSGLLDPLKPAAYCFFSVAGPLAGDVGKPGCRIAVPRGVAGSQSVSVPESRHTPDDRLPISSPSVDESVGHAFISYVREDCERVDKLQQALEAVGVRVWRDTKDLWPGQDWRRMIRRAITSNALVFIACFSTHSAARTTSYQNEELVLAVEQLRLRPPDVPWLIPVRFDECEVPDLDIGGGRTLASIQRADLFGDRREAQMTKLVAMVQGLLEQTLPSQDAGERTAAPALKLELVNAKWTLRHRASWLVDIQARFTNTTPDQAIELTRFDLVSDPGPSWEERPWLTQDQVDALFNEMMSRREAYGRAHFHEMALQPGDSRLVWVADHAYLPYPARKGKPYCELTVTDGEGEIYTLAIPGQGSHACVPPHGLLRLRTLARDGLGVRGRLPADGNEPQPIELNRFEGWAIKVADALESHPEFLAQFQSTLAHGREPDSIQIAHSVKTLVAIVRNLEARK
jgi:TIR domain